MLLSAAFREQRSCLSDTYNETSMRYDSIGSEHANCWPFTTIVNTAVLRRNTGERCAGEDFGS